jgi:hypothetical protein
MVSRTMRLARYSSSGCGGPMGSSVGSPGRAGAVPDRTAAMIAVESIPGRKLGRVRTELAERARTTGILEFADSVIAKGSLVKTDGASYSSNSPTPATTIRPRPGGQSGTGSRQRAGPQLGRRNVRRIGVAHHAVSHRIRCPTPGTAITVRCSKTCARQRTTRSVGRSRRRHPNPCVVHPPLETATGGRRVPKRTTPSIAISTQSLLETGGFRPNYASITTRRARPRRFGGCRSRRWR